MQSSVRYQPLPQSANGAIEFGSIFSYAPYGNLDAGLSSGYRLKRQAANHVLSKRFRDSNIVRDDEKGNLRRTLIETALIASSYVLFVVSLPFSLLLCLKFTKQFERLVVFRLGRLQRPKGPGAVVVLPCIDTWRRVDLRRKAFNVPPLQSVTNDGGLVELGATVYYYIKDAMAAIVSVQDWNAATRTLAHTTLHRLVNKKRLSDLTSDKRLLGQELLEELNQATFTWGMEITEVEVSDMKVLKEANESALNVLQTLAQPQVAGALWQSLTGSSGLSRAPAAPKDTVIEVETAARSVDLDKLISTLSSVLDETLVAEVGHVYQVECRGLGCFFLDLKNGAGEVGHGQAPSADVSIALEADDLTQLMLGSLSPLDAYLSQRIRVTGDSRAALRLDALASKIKATYGSQSSLSSLW